MMTTPLKLSECMDALESSSDIMQVFVNIKTGDIVFVSDEAINYAENDAPDSDYPKWMREDILQAKDYLNNPDDYILFPNKYDLDEYRLMEQFAYTQSEARKQKILLNALSEKGAFRRFKDSIYECHCSDEWYAFREEKMKAFIVEWCEDNSLTIK